MEIDCSKTKRKPPLDWDRLLPSDSDDDRPPELVVKPDHELTDNQTIDIELMNKSILDWLLPSDSDADRPPMKKSNDGGRGVDAQEHQLTALELLSKSDHAIMESLLMVNKTLQLMGVELPDKGAKEKENLCTHEFEIERRKKLESEKVDEGGEESTKLPDHHDDGAASHGKKKSGSKSPSGVVMSALTHDSLNDEKMKEIVNELVTLAISHYDVGKAAEVCYRDLVKAKVLFALPREMRRSYVLGLLHPQN